MIGAVSLVIFAVGRINAPHGLFGYVWVNKLTLSSPWGISHDCKGNVPRIISIHRGNHNYLCHRCWEYNGTNADLSNLS